MEVKEIPIEEYHNWQRTSSDEGVDKELDELVASIEKNRFA